MTEEFEATAQLRIAVNRLSRRIRAEKAGDELSDAQFSVLATLVREGSRTIGQLAEAERVTPPSMNRTVNALAEGGYVVREGSPDDGRKVFVKATASGVEFVTETRLRRDRWLDQRTRELTSAQRETLREASVIMRQLADS
ncbi:MAG TPA: MarR family transcriptional regulator [Gryllotalpicola sp.]